MKGFIITSINFFSLKMLCKKDIYNVNQGSSNIKKNWFFFLLNIVMYLCQDQCHSCCVYSSKWWFKTRKKSKIFIVSHSFALEFNIMLVQFPPLKILGKMPKTDQFYHLLTLEMNLDKFQRPYGKRWKGKSYFQLPHLEDY